MIFLIKKRVLLNYWLGTLLLVLFLSPLIRNVFGLILYLITSSAFFCFFMLDLFRRKLAFHSCLYTPLALLFFMSLFVILVSPNIVRPLYFVFWSVAFLLASYWLVKLDKKIVLGAAFVALNVFFIFFLISIVLYGYQPEDINRFFLNSSRNVVSATALFFQLLYSTAYYRYHRKLPQITPFLTLIVAIIAYGRSGIVLSSALVLFTLMVSFFEYNNVKKLFAFIIISIFLFWAALNYVQLQEFVIFNTNFHNNLESPRSVMNQGYLELLDATSVFTGADMYKVPLIDYYNNPHSSFILGHYQYGFLYVLYVLFFVAVAGLLFAFYKGTLVYSFFIFIFISRIYLDTLSLFGIYDFIFYFMFFAMLRDSRCCGFRFRHRA